MSFTIRAISFIVTPRSSSFLMANAFNSSMCPPHKNPCLSYDKTGDCMNHYINYYYSIYPDYIREQNEKFYFNYNDELYYFLVFDRPLEDSQYLYGLNVEMIRRGSLVHEIILNKDKNVVTFVDEVPYVLMRVYVNTNKNRSS